VDGAAHTVTRAGALVSLTPKEFDLLVALVRRHGAAATREDLLKEVWQYEDGVMTRTVDIHIAELRRKLEADPSRPQHILTVRKVGYRLQT
jgi:DNA-binding response OmpR family regulator